MMMYCCDVKTCPLGDKCGNAELNKQVGIPEGKNGLRVVWVSRLQTHLGSAQLLSVRPRVLSQTGARGFGLKTMVPLVAGQFLIEYRGEVRAPSALRVPSSPLTRRLVEQIISRNESYRRVLENYANAKSYYFLDYDGWEVVDAGQRGNSARFINHSCDPNVQVIRWKLASYDEYQVRLPRQLSLSLEG